jgi:biotin carboxyl carrier protein
MERPVAYGAVAASSTKQQASRALRAVGHQVPTGGELADHTAPRAPGLGEQCDIEERLVIAPAGGTFVPDGGLVTAPSGRVVEQGDIVAVVTRQDKTYLVVSGCRGSFVRFLAEAGDRVRQYQPIVWLHAL